MIQKIKNNSIISIISIIKLQYYPFDETYAAIVKLLILVLRKICIFVVCKHDVYYQKQYCYILILSMLNITKNKIVTNI